jgi:tetratricopeptide (TPR) repeat protein
MSRRVLALALLLAACRQRPEASSGAGPDPLAEARQALAQGQPDVALARLQGASDPEALLLQGQAWAKKAETAPLPAPPAAASPLPRGAAPAPAPEFKHEELQAIDCWERAIAAKPDLGSARLALAAMLAPRALARHQQELAAAARRPARRAPAAGEPGSLVLPGPDASPERVVREYRMAAQADPTSTTAVEAWAAFATSVGRLADADAALQELLKRQKERPEPFVRYGDFLLGVKKDPNAAIAQYSQALMWKADDESVKGKIADIYLDMAADHLAKQEWATAEARLRDAQKFVSDRTSARGARLQELQGQVAVIRGRPPGR